MERSLHKEKSHVGHRHSFCITTFLWRCWCWRNLVVTDTSYTAWTCKDKDKEKDLNLVLQESSRTRTRINITDWYQLHSCTHNMTITAFPSDFYWRTVCAIGPSCRLRRPFNIQREAYYIVINTVYIAYYAILVVGTKQRNNKSWFRPALYQLFSCSIARTYKKLIYRWQTARCV